MINLIFGLLGIPFETQTKENFVSYIHSLKQERSIGKLPKLPRVKKTQLFHKLNSETKLCDLCGKKARSEKAKCSGKKISQEEKISCKTETTGAKT